MQENKCIRDQLTQAVRDRDQLRDQVYEFRTKFDPRETVVEVTIAETHISPSAEVIETTQRWWNRGKPEMTLFGRKYAEPVTNHTWAFVAAVTGTLCNVTQRKIRELRQFDDYAWRRATEVKR